MGPVPGGPGMQVPQGNPYQNGMPTDPVPGSPGLQAPQGNPYQNGMPMGQPSGSPGIAPRENPYQGGGPEEAPNSRKEAWEAQYRQNHWSNQPGNQPQAPQGNPYESGTPSDLVPGGQDLLPPQGSQRIPLGNPYQNGAFSGVPQDVVERAEKTDFVPYEKIERKEEASEHKGISEPLIVDSEQDAGIVLEAAEEVLKLEERAEAMPGAAAQIPQEESGGIVAEKDGDREAFQDINEEENADSSKL